MVLPSQEVQRFRPTIKAPPEGLRNVQWSDTQDRWILSIPVYVFAQEEDAATWQIEHNLESFPSVTTVDLDGQQFFGSVRYVDANAIEVSFGAPIAGTAYLS